MSAARNRALGRLVPLVLVTVVVAGSVLALAERRAQARFDAAVEAYRAGRFAAAADLFRAEEVARGHAASAVLLHDLALAALHAGRLRDAEIAAEKAVARGGPRFVPFRDFVLGSTAWQRALQAEAEAGLLDADPTAFDRAIAHADAARAAWQSATVGGESAGAARRNVERALWKLEDLRARREAAEAERRARQEETPIEQPTPEGGDEGEPEEIEQEVAAQQDPDALSRRDVLALLARLAEIEEQKRIERRDRRHARGLAVERDW